MLDKLDELKESLDELTYCYSELDDTDAATAFYLMKESSSLQSSYEKVSADLLKVLADAERQAKATQARVSRESSTKVNEGDRIAASSEEVLAMWEHVSEVQKSQRYIESSAKFLSRIYFDCKLIYENVCRATRTPIGDDKLVGRF